MTKNSIRKKQAFSLIELAIVVVIIGVLIVGVIGGSGLIRGATITSARSFTVKSVVPKIDGLVAWYETSLIQSLKTTEDFDAAQISTWYDVSPGTLATRVYDATSTVPTNTLARTASSALVYKAEGINKIPSLNFSGTTTGLSLASFYQGSLTQSTIFLVFNAATTNFGSGFNVIDSHSSSATASLINLTLSNMVWGLADGSTQTVSASALTGNKDLILAFYFNGTSSKFFLNDATTSGNQTSSQVTNPLNGLTLGTNKSGTTGFSGMISELIIYNRPLKLQERRDVMKYLSHKYNISVTGI